MKINNTRTPSVRTEDVVRTTHLIDADGKILGRLAVKIAGILRGKGRVDYTPHVDQGDSVVVINCERIRVTGKKAEQKIYKTFSGYPDGLKEYSYEHMMENHPEDILMHAVRGMLPKSILGRRMLKRLWVYTGTKHPHEAQKPVPLAV